MTEKYHNAVIDYTFEGKRYGLYFPAASAEDAKRRLAAIKATGRFEGWPCFTVPADPIRWPFARLWLALKVWLFEREQRND